MDIQTVWRFLAWLAGCSIPTGIVLYVVKRLTKGVGDRITHAVDAYASERAKLMAQSHNLDRLIEQTEKLTATTEAIKARISDEVWDRQMRWNLKKDVYIRLMETLGQHMTNHQYNMHLESVRRRDPNNALFPSVRDEAIRRSQTVQTELVKVACSAPLVVSSESHRILIDTQRALHHINYDDPEFQKTCQQNIAVLQNGLDALMVSAQKDLGIEISH